jgi:hypothetical protein
MAYFVKIGSIPTNKSGVGSRGYQLFRRGRYIVVRWGAVEVIKPRRFYWCYKPQEKIYSCKSALAAKEEMREMTRHRIENEGYSALPVGAKIGAQRVDTPS